MEHTRSMPRLVLKPGRERSLRRFHPWVFSGAIDRVEPEAFEGDAVHVYSAADDFLATGFYSHSDIAVKVISFNKIVPDIAFFESAIGQALQLRRALGVLDSEATNVARLVNAEGDLLPGLIADRYNETVVLQFHSWGMWRSRRQIAAAFRAHLGEVAIYSKSADTLSRYSSSAGGEQQALDSYLAGAAAPPAVVREHGHSFEVDWERGQKTGFYIDQRENRRLAGDFSAGKRVLNVFSYTGGFTVYALAAGARAVVSVDSSEEALAGTKKNIALNQLQAEHEEVPADAFDYLGHADERFDLLILDPPPFAKAREAVAGALKGYRAINYHAVKLLKPGGLLFTFSCSQLVGRDLFREQVSRAGVQAGRRLTVLRELSAAPCHAVNLHHPEGEYLKGLMLSVA